jgi:nucleotide-binding universal stress UspA family protein
MAKLRHIVHATDFSAASRGAFAKAVEFARDHGARLTLAHVQAPVLPIAAEGYIPPDTYERVEASLRLQAEKEMGRLVAKARRAGLRRVDSVLLTGTPDVEIVRLAKGRRADLLVMGTHGRTGLARVFLGSVASRVIAAASCPVLTVRGR